MSQVVKTSGDYIIRTGVGGTVLFDTGPSVGNVRITGNLVVEGNTINVEVEQLNVEDNIITLNSNETGSGVTLGYSGIEVNRGLLDNASLVFEESTKSWLVARGQNGSYSFAESKLKLRDLVFVNPGADLDYPELLIQNTEIGSLRITGNDTYEDSVLDDDDIPNKKYVDRRIIENPTFSITRGDTKVLADDVSDPYDPLLLESRVQTIVDDNIILTVYNNRVVIQELQFNLNQISNPNTNENIRLVTNGSGKIEIDSSVQFNHNAGIPAVVTDSTVVYGASPSADGGSGVYFVNPQVSGELISKRKALTFSIIF